MLRLNWTTWGCVFGSIGSSFSSSAFSSSSFSSSWLLLGTSAFSSSFFRGGVTGGKEYPGLFGAFVLPGVPGVLGLFFF